MKQLLTYYFAILLPLPLLAWSAFNDTTMFAILLLSYYLYRSFLDGRRLVEKQLISKQELWKAFIPFWTSMFFRQLYFE